ncbi:hypothetical protein [Streptomyces yanii]|uniref:Uncharacterized protein n=1 Tax=Streptomyces yanii TaxID=78510 RepID=A0ABV5REN1_9ACTN
MAVYTDEVLPVLPDQSFSDQDEASSWLDDESGNLIACATAESAVRTPIWRYTPFVLGTYSVGHGRLSGLLQLSEALVATIPDNAMLGEWPYDILLLHGQKILMNGLSLVLLRRGEPEEAALTARQGSEVAAARSATAALEANDMDAALLGLDGAIRTLAARGQRRLESEARVKAHLHSPVTPSLDPSRRKFDRTSMRRTRSSSSPVRMARL